MHHQDCPSPTTATAEMVNPDETWTFTWVTDGKVYGLRCLNCGEMVTQADTVLGEPQQPEHTEEGT